MSIALRSCRDNLQFACQMNNGMAGDLKVGHWIADLPRIRSLLMEQIFLNLFIRKCRLPSSQTSRCTDTNVSLIKVMLTRNTIQYLICCELPLYIYMTIHQPCINTYHNLSYSDIKLNINTYIFINIYISVSYCKLLIIINATFVFVCFDQQEFFF